MRYYPEDCPRGCTDCRPLAQVKSDFPPLTFVCVGQNNPETRAVEQDIFRLCHKSAEGIDVMHNADRRDLLDHSSVICQALAMHEEELLVQMEGQAD